MSQSYEKNREKSKKCKIFLLFPNNNIIRFERLAK